MPDWRRTNTEVQPATQGRRMQSCTPVENEWSLLWVSPLAHALASNIMQQQSAIGRTTDHVSLCSVMHDALQRSLAWWFFWTGKCLHQLLCVQMGV